MFQKDEFIHLSHHVKIKAIKTITWLGHLRMCWVGWDLEQRLKKFVYIQIMACFFNKKFHLYSNTFIFLCQLKETKLILLGLWFGYYVEKPSVNPNFSLSQLKYLDIVVYPKNRSWKTQAKIPALSFINFTISSKSSTH